MTLHPTAGARFALERGDAADDRASYRASIYTPTERFDYELALAIGEPPRITPESISSLESQLLAIAKQVARQAGKSRDQGVPVWPRRVLRWKGPGRGG